MLNDEGEFEELTRSRYDEHSFVPVALKGDGINGYVSSYVKPDGSFRDKAAIYKYNFKIREFGDLVFEHPRVDVTAAATSNKTRDIIAIGYQIGIPETIYVDENWKKLMAGINQALPGTINAMSSTDEDETADSEVVYSKHVVRCLWYMENWRGFEPLVDLRAAGCCSSNCSSTSCRIQADCEAGWRGEASTRTGHGFSLAKLGSDRGRLDPFGTLCATGSHRAHPRSRT